jgi:hypothetical protein
LATQMVNPTQVGWTVPKVMVIIDYIFHSFLKPPNPPWGALFSFSSHQQKSA